jgi:hypothetical protein
VTRLQLGELARTPTPIDSVESKLPRTLSVWNVKACALPKQAMRAAAAAGLSRARAGFMGLSPLGFL